MKKLTDKQKSRLWEQQRNVNFQASCLLEKGKGPAKPDIETLELGPSAPGLPHLCLIHRHLFRNEMKGAGELRTAIFLRATFLFAISSTSRKWVMS